MMQTTYIPNFDFVLFNPPSFYEKKGGGSGELSGELKLKITTVDNLYIGSGFSEDKTTGFCLETMKFENTLIIPGSSLKGAVRKISSAISGGCIKEERNVRIPEKISNIKCYAKNIEKQIKSEKCIVCDMFGMISKVSYASKISFSDFVSEGLNTQEEKINQQFSPNIESPKYKDENNKHKGYKFYKNDCEEYSLSEKVNVETVKRDTVFEGKITFKKLEKEQLQLLLFSLGLDESFNMKIGGFKNDGYGQIKTEAISFKINEDGNIKEENVKSYAENYTKGYGKKFITSIQKLREILKPKM